MSSRELIESLRRSGDGKVRDLWQEAEAEAAKIRAGIVDQIGRLRAESERVRSARTGAVLTAALSEANSRVRISRLKGEQTISDRMFSASVGSLRQLRGNDYPILFEKLALELPILTWQEVRVNPEDVGCAKKYFPGAKIVPDENIIGGVDAIADGGAIRVVNTFEKRLERAWMELLPDLIKDVYREVADDAPPES